MVFSFMSSRFFNFLIAVIGIEQDPRTFLAVQPAVRFVLTIVLNSFGQLILTVVCVYICTHIYMYIF